MPILFGPQRQSLGEMRARGEATGHFFLLRSLDPTLLDTLRGKTSGYLSAGLSRSATGVAGLRAGDPALSLLGGNQKPVRSPRMLTCSGSRCVF